MLWHHSPTKTSIDINMEYLCQHWVHSYEEQQNPYADEDQIYRPKDFKVFEASGRRGRETYIFTRMVIVSGCVDRARMIVAISIRESGEWIRTTRVFFK